MEIEETTQQIGPWTVRAVWTETGPFPSELHITTDKQGAARCGITGAVLRDVKLSHPNPPETVSAMGTALDALRTVRNYQSDGKGPLSDNYLKALAAAYVAMSKTKTTEPVETMSHFLPDDSGTIENHLTEAEKLGFLERGEDGSSAPQSKSNSLGEHLKGPLVLESDMTDRESVTPQKQAKKGNIKVRVFRVDAEGNKTLVDVTVDGECAHDDSLDCKGLRAQRTQRYEDRFRTR
ncbi:hypothetical protein ACFU53_17885 [Streptomyces sp. NPDC057474]|uniref:hypothetical protein n=1 Tax=Streptomyces sp. NPDC057474 TaxID=3346144 RepID=UPI0036CF38C1